MLQEREYTLRLRTWIPSAIAAAMLAAAGAYSLLDWDLPANYYRLLRVVVTAAALHLIADALVIRLIRLQARGQSLEACRSALFESPEKSFDPDDGWEEYLEALEDKAEEEGAHEEETTDEGRRWTEAHEARVRATWDADVDERLENWRLERPIEARRDMVEVLRSRWDSDYGLGRIWVFAFVAILFNPLEPIYLSQQDWSGIDLAAAFAFALLASNVRAERLKAVIGVTSEAQRLESEIRALEERYDSPRDE